MSEASRGEGVALEGWISCVRVGRVNFRDGGIEIRAQGLSWQLLFHSLHNPHLLHVAPAVSAGAGGKSEECHTPLVVIHPWEGSVDGTLGPYYHVTGIRDNLLNVLTVCVALDHGGGGLKVALVTASGGERSEAKRSDERGNG